MKYRISYEVESSNSMDNNIDYYAESLELDWENLDIAKQKLKRIEEHYDMHEKMNSWQVKDKNKLLEKYQDKDWFVNKQIQVVFNRKNPAAYFRIDNPEKFLQKEAKKKYGIKTMIDQTSAEHCIILYTDDGKPWQIYCPWCGMFEKLISIEIVPNDSGMKKVF
jgi:hypothetical protein